MKTTTKYALAVGAFALILFSLSRVYQDQHPLYGILDASGILVATAAVWVWSMGRTKGRRKRAALALALLGLTWSSLSVDAWFSHTKTGAFAYLGVMALFWVPAAFLYRAPAHPVRADETTTDS